MLLNGHKSSRTLSNVSGVINQYSSNLPCNAPQGKYCRETPDVSLHSDITTPYSFYCTSIPDGCTNGSHWYGVAGTSCAAPILAAITALTNEESVKQGGFNIGFLNQIGRAHV